MIQWPRHASSPELEHAVAPQGIRGQHEAKVSLTLCETLPSSAGHLNQDRQPCNRKGDMKVRRCFYIR